ncbi:MAG TPA: hypothetical protein VF690_12990 [Hymenobacter sp.]|jgi:hypothetical protein
MKAITLHPYSPTEAGRTTLTGALPENWTEVPLGLYAQLASAKSVRQRIEATALICKLPAAPLLEDAGLFGPIVRAAPWLFHGPLPEDLKRVTLFTHEGIEYRFVGDLHRINAEQLETLLNFVNDHHRAPLLAAPSLLAVLYCRVGAVQDTDAVEAAAEAFTRLPVSVAWPALLDFLRSGASAALHIRNFSGVVAATQQLLQELEAATAGGSSRYWPRLQRWLTRTWIRSAKSLL